MTNYYSQRRTVSETVIIGEKAITVKADYQWQDDNERIDVAIQIDGTEHVFPDVDDDGLRSFANVFVTVSNLIATEAADVETA